MNLMFMHNQEKLDDILYPPLTYLQARILASAETQKGHSPGTVFFRTKGYSETPFLKGIRRSPHLNEEKIKSGNSYEEVRPAIQTRLAYMEFFKEGKDIARKHKNSLLGRIIMDFKIKNILSRNEKMRKKVVKNYLKKRGRVIKYVRPERFITLSLITPETSYDSF